MVITLLPQNGLFTGVRQFFADKVFPEGKNLRNLAERAANIDELTGLANRRAFDLAQATAEADNNLSFVVFDANNFKHVNTILGHTIGSKVLQNIASVIKLAASRYRVATRCFRYGGDEFVVICPKTIAAEIRDTIEYMYPPFEIKKGVMVSISGTIGRTFDIADRQLEGRKAAHKKNAVL